LSAGSVDFDRGHVLYRMYDKDSYLLYVGISAYLSTRLGAHQASKDWWFEVSTITLEHYIDRNSALQAERDAIAHEHPRENVARPAHQRLSRTSIDRKMVPQDSLRLFLAEVQSCTEQLEISADRYQRSLLVARKAGATWPQMADAMGLSEGGARGRFKSAEVGGLITLQLKPIELIIDQSMSFD
jgi:predicted GIY-YIG superfamily endonuclease